MELWREALYQSMRAVNLLILASLLLGSATYTLLLLISLISVWLNSRRNSYANWLVPLGRDSAPPVTIIIPAWNEEQTITSSVVSSLRLDYPALEVMVVDDGSTDATVECLVRAFHLTPADLGYIPMLGTRPVRAFYSNPELKHLTVISKENGGKADALNAGVNFCRTPYFCTLDSDCILERDAVRRLMGPVISSPLKTVASGGTIRILNGCRVVDGRVETVNLPARLIEKLQVIEYLRSFLFGRTGWSLLGGTLIVSGAFALFHRQTVLEIGGFRPDTVTEDMDLIVRLQRRALERRDGLSLAFTADPVCWTECPRTLRMLSRQRRRWQLGLCQTLWRNSDMLFNWKYGAIGLFSFPFHLYCEALGAPLEALGYLMVPIAFLIGLVPPLLFLFFLFLALVYGTFLSAGAVLLQELVSRPYPRFRDLKTMVRLAVLENFGYRQLIVFYRLQGALLFVTGFRKWEKVAHLGPAPPAFS